MYPLETKYTYFLKNFHCIWVYIPMECEISAFTQLVLMKQSFFFLKILLCILMYFSFMLIFNLSYVHAFNL